MKPDILLAALLSVAIAPFASGQNSVTVTTIHSFEPNADGNMEGIYPDMRLVEGANGSLYGTDPEGGANAGAGVAFEVTPDGVLTVLRDFAEYVDTSGGGFRFLKLGNTPESGLLLGHDGNFYGTTVAGGSYGSGNLYQLTPSKGFKVIHNFSAVDGNDISVEGGLPFGPLAQDDSGNLYGTTGDAGPHSKGTVFMATIDGGFTVLHAFSAPDANKFNDDGYNAIGGLAQGPDGAFYGVTSSGGAFGNGTVFKVTADGKFTTLYAFSAIDANKANSDGSVPKGGLTLGADGNFYGTTAYGGNYAHGTVFKMTPEGDLVSLHSFNPDAGEGANPFYETLIPASDGSLYGTTYYGGANKYGTIFRITLTGTLTTLHSFAGGSKGDGQYPYCGLVQTKDGSFYGVTSEGGIHGTGAVFKMIVADDLAIAGPLDATATVGAPFSYLIKVASQGASFAATGLPPGLSINAATGEIAGIPTQAGTYAATVSVKTLTGAGAATLALDIREVAVTLSTATPKVKLGSGAPGVFTLTLSAAQDHKVTVHYKVKGSAINGTDYTFLSGSTKIKAGKTSKPINIFPRGDLGGASSKAVKLELAPGEGYTVGTTDKVTVKIVR